MIVVKTYHIQETVCPGKYCTLCRVFFFPNEVLNGITGQLTCQKNFIAFTVKTRKNE